jgi:hypothetical protein
MKARRWVVVGIMRLRAQSDGMLSIGDERNMYGVPMVGSKKEICGRITKKWKLDRNGSVVGM